MIAALAHGMITLSQSARSPLAIKAAIHSTRIIAGFLVAGVIPVNIRLRRIILMRVKQVDRIEVGNFQLFHQFNRHKILLAGRADMFSPRNEQDEQGTIQLMDRVAQLRQVFTCHTSLSFRGPVIGQIRHQVQCSQYQGTQTS